MTRETLEELRERLLRKHSVQRMIQLRAYEIYQMRGGHPGGEAQDWFHAESEVLAFLIARESAQEDEQAAAAEPTAEESQEAPAKKRPRARAAAKLSDVKQPAKKKAAKRDTPKKSAETKAKPKRASGKSKSEDSGQ